VVCCSFIRLADYLIVDMLHTLTVNSISALLGVISTQIHLTPAKSAIVGWTSVLDEIPAEIPGLTVSSFFNKFNIINKVL